MTQPAKPPHVVFLFSDTGGGHRSAAEAIIEAINLEFPGRISTEMVDFFKQYAPPPFDLAPEMYPPMARMKEMWELGYKLSNGKRRTTMLNELFWPYVRRAAFKLVAEHPCDLFVSVHPIIITPLLLAFGDSPHPPVYTVVTDMVSTHAFWYNNFVDQLFVPTEEARRRGILNGLREDQVCVVGLPIADRFCKPVGDRAALREKLGWPQQKPAVLLVGGGEGMGPLERTALAINNARLDITLAVVTGRNKRLKKSLEMVDWRMPTFVYGFVRDMPDLMGAADVLVSKAGPGTISESFIAGLPIILYSKVPGQEDGNVTYVVEQGAGVWAPQPEQVVATLRRWLTHPELRLQTAEASRRLARPDASRLIARAVAEKVGIAKLTVE
jgi:1,2-diacylglycerol 3-beta-galactosyltransferase